MNYQVPDLPLTPPDNELRKAFTCEICEEPIYEGYDYYDIPGLGKCCEECISGARRYNAEA